MKPNYKTNDPKGWMGDPKRGAAMGRASILEADSNTSRKIYLRRIRLNSGGYDSNGTYFGWGTSLWWYADTKGEIDAMCRAVNRNEAKAMIRGLYPNIRFFK